MDLTEIINNYFSAKPRLEYNISEDFRNQILHRDLKPEFYQHLLPSDFIMFNPWIIKISIIMGIFFIDYLYEVTIWPILKLYRNLLLNKLKGWCYKLVNLFRLICLL